MREHWDDLSSTAKTGLVLSVVGFFVELSSFSTSTRGGTFSCSYIDFGALGLGIGAVVAGGSALIGVSKTGNPRLNQIAAGIALGVGVLHILRGVGFVGGPCG